MNQFLQLGGIFVTAFVVGLSGAMMPGPLLAVTIDESMRRGAWAGPLIVAGHALLEAALVAAVALGLTTFLHQPAAVCLISLAGGAVLLWMGQDMIGSVGRLSMDFKGSTRRAMHPVVAGVVISLSNPYWTLWWVTIGITYIVMGLRFGVIGIVTFFAGHILSDLAWYGLVSTAVAKGRRFISNRVYRTLIVVCGLALLAFGAWFIWTGAALLRTAIVSSTAASIGM